MQHLGGEPGYSSSVHLLPAHGVGVITFSATRPLGNRTSEAIRALLREGGVLDAPPGPPAAGLVEAREAIVKLLDRWDGPLLERAFDPQTLAYSWMKSLPDEFAKIARDHGRCRPEGPIRPRGRASGSFALGCERGTVEVTMLLAPGTPVRIQALRWRDEPSGGPAHDPFATCVE